MDQFEMDGGFDGGVHNEEYFYIHGNDVYSTQSLLASLGVKQEKSVYKNSSNDFVRWPFSAGEFFGAVSSARLEGSDLEALLQEGKSSLKKSIPKSRATRIPRAPWKTKTA